MYIRMEPLDGLQTVKYHVVLYHFIWCDYLVKKIDYRWYILNIDRHKNHKNVYLGLGKFWLSTLILLVFPDTLFSINL